MRILFVSDLLSYGGASKLIYDLLPRMVRLGHFCELLILTDKNSKYIDELTESGVSVHVVPNNVQSKTGRIRYIKRFITQNNYDVVHANLFPVIYYCSIAKRLSGKSFPKLVMTEHSTDNKRRHKAFLRPLERFIYKNYDHIISISDKTQENLCGWLKLKDNSKFSVIHNGIDIDRFKSAECLNREAVITNPASDDILLLTVGSFTRQKNHLKLLEAIALLPDNFKLILCGEGPLKDEIIEKINSLDIVNRVDLLGFRKDIDRIMHTADILVIPSIWEGFGLIAAEGMACGIPMAVSDVPGLSEVVGDAGIKFDPDSAESIKTAIIEASDKTKSYELSAKGQNRVLLYDINNVVREYIEVYERC